MDSTLDRSRQELLQRLKYTIQVSEYQDIEEILKTLVMKENVKEVYEDLFTGCSVDSKGRLITGPFFDADYPSASMDFAAYNLLGWAPDSFLLKHQVRRIEVRQAYGVAENYSVAPGIFQLPNLEVLILSGLGIAELPIPAFNCSSLKHLDLSRNNLSTISKDFWRFSRLKKLNLEYNALENLDFSLKGVAMLQSLNLRGNGLSTIPAGLERLPRLTEINLEANRIDTIPDAMERSKSLKTMRLSYNNLSASQEAFWEEGGAMGACQMDLPL